MIARLEQVEEPAIELLVDPEVARTAGLVRQATGGDDGHAQRRRVGADDLAQHHADPVRALGTRNRRHRAVHRHRHQAEARVGVQIMRRHRDAVVELHLGTQVGERETAPRALVDDEAREPGLAGHAVFFHAEPLVEPVGRPHVLAGDADRVLGDVVDRPVEEMIVAEHHEHVGSRGLEATPHLGGRGERLLLKLFRRAIEPAGEAGRMGHGHGGDDVGHAHLRGARAAGADASRRACSASARAVSSGNARL